MAGIFDRFRRRLSDETLLVRTHHPEFQDPAYKVGSLISHQGGLYVVTRRVELPPVPLQRGGSVPQWDVFGRPADAVEIDALLAEASEGLQRGGAQGAGSKGEGPEGSPGGSGG